MAKRSQSSFRRILLSRILLLSIPVLLLGEVVTYRKARSALLETSRRNLTESAVRKGRDIQEAISALQKNLLLASEAIELKADPGTAQTFLSRLQQDLLSPIQCIQLAAIQTGQPIADTCTPSTQTNSEQAIPSQSQSAQRLHTQLWSPKHQAFLKRAAVYITPARNALERSQNNSDSQLRLILSVPVYSQTGELRAVLSIQTSLHQPNNDQPGSLSGSTVVIDQNGTILAHPQVNWIDRNIIQEDDAIRLQDIVTNALETGKPDVRHLFNFEEKRGEWLAGYSPIQVPISGEPNYRWVVLAVTPLTNALYGLEEIQQILYTLTLGLVATILLATLYVAHDLSLPLEQLGNYALCIQQRHRNRLEGKDIKLELHAPEDELSASDCSNFEQAPKDFKIWEMNQLAVALDSMVKQLEERAQELETAWREAEAANRLKSEFLANTSHELRTPLNAIIGCLRLVRDGCCDDREEEVEFLQRADEAAIHLLNVINDLLDIAKIESGTLSITMEPINVHHLVAEVINLQSVHIQQKGLKLVLPDLTQPIDVLADPAKLKQVLLNVVCNAVKFTEQGQVAIETCIEAVQPGKANGSSASLSGRQVVVTIQDTGIGVDPTQQPKLFRPFVMADGSSTRKYEGTGLGLAISRSLMELMGGTITLHSAGKDQGTTVAVVLPVIEAISDSHPAPVAEDASLSATAAIDRPTNPRLETRQA